VHPYRDPLVTNFRALIECIITLLFIGFIMFDCFQILLFNCMTVRDPQRLLSCLLDTCAQNGMSMKLHVSVA
jgi:hypothetical protein